MPMFEANDNDNDGADGDVDDKDDICGYKK